MVTKLCTGIWNFFPLIFGLKYLKITYIQSLKEWYFYKCLCYNMEIKIFLHFGILHLICSLDKLGD
ncbi:cofilin 2, muscle (predicted), isoform CRA_a [Rattus norvegicus]|uniref:Cofilin 2, muscle (Predicted), isoform CRA_a n=1 Tax=Rattus norvegicus TaxID=10116 RepID=A6HBL0_RAT|nr:cofilin 2, muscle (predicted), isoform CRA_a [Rattus norvegicus]EDM03416.1 cofilin 2, muscle (predicted), isoform CRA_a [Rattus norvegicus]